MGEIADMMLDGTMRQGCGVWLHDGEDGPGYPGYCSACQPDDKPEYGCYNGKRRKKREQCQQCGKKLLDGLALKQHMKDKHGEIL